MSQQEPWHHFRSSAVFFGKEPRTGSSLREVYDRVRLLGPTSWADVSDLPYGTVKAAVTQLKLFYGVYLKGKSKYQRVRLMTEEEVKRHLINSSLEPS